MFPRTCELQFKRANGQNYKTCRSLRGRHGPPRTGVIPRKKWAKMFETNTLLASMVWGAVGTCFFIYGKKQSATAALVGGLAMIAVSYLVSSVLFMSLISVALIVGTVAFMRRGY
jgi:hypothetical protein